MKFNTKLKQNLNTKQKLNFWWFCVGFVFCFMSVLWLLVVPIFFTTKSAQAASASLYLSPSTGTFLAGSTFDVSIFVDTAKNNINTIDVDLKFDPRRLQITNPSTGKSLISEWISLPVYSNAEGTISFQGGVPPPGINTNSGLISTLTFRAMTAGQAVIDIQNSSLVLLADGKGTNALGNTGQAVFEIIIPPQAGPEIRSVSHANPNQWYRDTNAVFSWTKEEGVNGFSYLIDQSPDNIPDNIPEGEIPSVVFNDLPNGIWYFHLKAKKGDVWSGTSHYLVKIDTLPPKDLELKLEGAIKNLAVPIAPVGATLLFAAQDTLSGIDYYAIKIINLLENENAQDSFFVEIASPFHLPQLEPAEYETIVRAYDRAGNWLDNAKKVEITGALEFFYSSRKGMGMGKLFFRWWQISLGLAFLTIAPSSIIWWWRHSHKSLASKRKAAEELKFKISQHEEAIKKQISQERAGG